MPYGRGHCAACGSMSTPGHLLCGPCFWQAPLDALWILWDALDAYKAGSGTPEAVADAEAALVAAVTPQPTGGEPCGT
jgi:hypothetical protein